MEDRATHGAFVPVVAAGKPPVRQMESPVSFKHGYMDAWSKQKLKTLFERSTKSTSAYQQHAPVQKAERPAEMPCPTVLPVPVLERPTKLLPRRMGSKARLQKRKVAGTRLNCPRSRCFGFRQGATGSRRASSRPDRASSSKSQEAQEAFDGR